MEPHGELTFHWVENILVVRANGPFNDEGTRVAREAFQVNVLKGGFATWYRLELWDESVLGTPDAMAQLEGFYKWGVEQGCAVTAIVIQNSLQANIIKTGLSDFADVFNSEVKAMEWLKNKAIQLFPS